MKYGIWASKEDEPPDPDGAGFRSYVERYTTREGVLAEARRLLNAGRSVEIIPVSDGAPLPGEGEE